MQETSNFLWAGYDETIVKAYRKAIDRELHRKVDTVGTACEALQLLHNFNYPLLIVQNEVGQGAMTSWGLKDGVMCETRVSQDLIHAIRTIDHYKETPIVLHGANSAYAPFDKYEKAGATECYDALQSNTIENFLHLLRKHL